jgi:hypothetical protein
MATKTVNISFICHFFCLHYNGMVGDEVIITVYDNDGAPSDQKCIAATKMQ